MSLPLLLSMEEGHCVSLLISFLWTTFAFYLLIGLVVRWSFMSFWMEINLWHGSLECPGILFMCCHKIIRSNMQLTVYLLAVNHSYADVSLYNMQLTVSAFMQELLAKFPCLKLFGQFLL